MTLSDQDSQVVHDLVAKYGLRPVVNAVAGSAEALLKAGWPVMDEHGAPMDREDIETAVTNLRDGLY